MVIGGHFAISRQSLPSEGGQLWFLFADAIRLPTLNAQPSSLRFVHRLEINAMFPHMKHQQKTARALKADRAVPDSDFARSLVQAEAADNIDGFTP
jgi:hypothetical protein